MRVAEGGSRDGSSIGDLSTHDAGVHANSRIARKGESLMMMSRLFARPGATFAPVVVTGTRTLMSHSIAPAYAGSWSSLPTPLSEWV
jgi:hypothetical protein